jgi:hypothetical protein
MNLNACGVARGATGYRLVKAARPSKESRTTRATRRNHVEPRISLYRRLLRGQDNEETNCSTAEDTHHSYGVHVSMALILEPVAPPQHDVREGQYDREPARDLRPPWIRRLACPDARAPARKRSREDRDWRKYYGAVDHKARQDRWDEAEHV